ncbi:hypothetical protein B2A_01220, partial [mine drainage metagenome]
PPMAIFGPKVMIINQFSGSGGDALPWYFKMDHVGTLVGERTWGGLVGSRRLSETDGWRRHHRAARRRGRTQRTFPGGKPRHRAGCHRVA